METAPDSEVCIRFIEAHRTEARKCEEVYLLSNIRKKTTSANPVILFLFTDGGRIVTRNLNCS